MTPEEIKVYKQMTEDAQKYVHNVMGLQGEFNKEEFAKIVEEKKDPSLFTDFDTTQKNINMTTLIQGYGNFGRKFIEEVFAKDSASALNMFEVVTQEYLDLQAAIQEQFNAFQKDLLDKQNIEEAVQETNKED